MAWGTALETVDKPLASARVRLTCWGDFRIVDTATGTDVKPRGRKARALLAYLAFHPGKPVSRERLTGLLWGDRGEEQARASLRQTIFELKALGRDARNLLHVDREHVQLDPDALVTDIDELHAFVAQGDFAAFLNALPDRDDRLFANLGGLDEGFDDWLAIERTRQCDALAALIVQAQAAALAGGSSGEASALRTRIAELDPSRAAGLGSAVELAPSIALSPSGSAGDSQRWRIALLVAVLLAFAVLAVGAWQFQANRPPPPTAVAVLPFTSLSGRDDAYFAEGLAEEIMARLAREPGLRVAARSSAWQFKDRPGDPEAVARKLGVSHVLEGSVRSAGGRIRVNVALVQASDGLQLWAETFDGSLDDVFAIQNRIGARVTSSLQRRLARSDVPPSATPSTSGAVYSLYLGARGLIRERNPQAFAAAKPKLLRALELDPGFAPAWSSLAQIENFEGNSPGAEARASRETAQLHARRALALAPDLAEAHGILGMILGFDDPEGRQHIKRAAALDPNSAELQFWLGHVYGNEPDFPRMRAAYHRAFTIDPLWGYAGYYAVASSWRMGHRADALAYVKRIEVEGSRHQAHMIRGELARIRGDFSQAVQEFAAARAATGDPGKAMHAAFYRAFVLFDLDLLDESRRAWDDAGKAFPSSGGTRPTDPYRVYFAIRRGHLPTLGELRERNASSFVKDEVYATLAAKRLVNVGRARDVVALYDSADGFLGMSRSRPAEPSQVRDESVTIASALRAVGRGAEADRILQDSDRRIEAALRRSRGQAPGPFLAEAAQTWAMLGKRDIAVTALDRAMRNGWVYVDGEEGGAQLDDIGDESAFRGLRGDPRFERIRSRLREHLTRERRELAATAL